MFKPSTEFQKNRATKDGYQWQCKSCRDKTDRREGRAEYHRRRYHEKKHLYLEAEYRRSYGIGLADYNAMLEAQGGVCAICKEMCKSGRRLAVDHCHTTGKVRGLLCGRCNSGIADFRDDPARLHAALAYLAKHAA